jgi:hypothetical protein
VLDALLRVWPYRAILNAKYPVASYFGVRIPISVSVVSITPQGQRGILGLVRRQEIRSQAEPRQPCVPKGRGSSIGGIQGPTEGRTSDNRQRSAGAVSARWRD